MRDKATYTPTSSAQVGDIIKMALNQGHALAIEGAGTRSSIGRGAKAHSLDMTGLSGIIDYDPSEMVLTAYPGTPLAELEEAIGEHHQVLAFEPFGQGTIGGVIACAIAGPQRLGYGAARDHVLGIEAVSGHGEIFRAGGKVVKNVTGYDLPKLLTGSWGRLGAITELTLKVLPQPQASRTRLVRGLSVAQSVMMMSCALNSKAQVCAAAHLPHKDMTLFRLSGFEVALDERCRLLDAATLTLEEGDPALWNEVREVSALQEALVLWRVILPAQNATAFVASLPADIQWLMDWAGGLLWVAGGTVVRTLAARCGGHATLYRAPPELYAHTPVFHPQDTGIETLCHRVRRAFDPLGVFETGRFDGVFL